MNHKIEQEIDRTLSCLDASDSIQPSDFFLDSLSNKLSHLRTRRGIGYRNRSFYPVVILLMVLLNLTVLLASLGAGRSATDGIYDQDSVIANEYGIGQSSYVAF